MSNPSVRQSCGLVNQSATVTCSEREYTCNNLDVASELNILSELEPLAVIKNETRVCDRTEPDCVGRLASITENLWNPHSTLAILIGSSLFDIGLGLWVCNQERKPLGRAIIDISAANQGGRYPLHRTYISGAFSAPEILYIITDVFVSLHPCSAHLVRSEQLFRLCPCLGTEPTPSQPPISHHHHPISISWASSPLGPIRSLSGASLYRIMFTLRRIVFAPSAVVRRPVLETAVAISRPIMDCIQQQRPRRYSSSSKPSGPSDGTRSSSSSNSTATNSIPHNPAMRRAGRAGLKTIKAPSGAIKEGSKVPVVPSTDHLHPAGLCFHVPFPNIRCFH